MNLLSETILEMGITFSHMMEKMERLNKFGTTVVGLTDQMLNQHY